MKKTAPLKFIIAFSVFCLAGTVVAQTGNLFGAETAPRTLQLRQQLVKGMNAATPASGLFEDSQSFPHKKTAAVAALYSLLLPGMGELYADGFESGRYFLGAEAGLWITYASFETYGTWLQSDARSFAVAHSGATSGGKNDQFYVDLSNYMNVYEYNDQKLRDRQPEKVYDPNNGYFWQWDSDANRQQFHTSRISSDRVFNNSRFVIGAIIVNHIVSALNAARLVRRYNYNVAESGINFRIESSLLSDSGAPDGLLLTVRGVF
jgi:hypothetical protein